MVPLKVCARSTGKDAGFVAISLAVALLTGLLYARSAYAAGPIVLDGAFEDWDGQAHVDDPEGDAINPKTDIKAFYFATNPDEETAYFMLERWENKLLKVEYILWVDTDNDGLYDEPNDRRIDVSYDPFPRGYVDVDLFNGTGGFIRTIAIDAPWGETRRGARAEWGVSFADLGIAPFQTIRLQAVSIQGNKVSDQAAELQWSPADALGQVGVAVLALGGAAWLYFRRKKIECPRR